MYDLLKRSFDVLLAILVLLVLLPFLLPVMIGLRLTGEGYVFFRQKRIGLHNQPFPILKFATMLKDSPNMGTGTITLRNDPRITPMGGFLRKTKINELPQILNVLFGDMSWVGPRPLDDRAFSAYPPHVRDSIYQVRPGITGIGSIIFRDEEKWFSTTDLPLEEFRKSVIAPYKGALEMWYLTRRSFLTDLKILFLTAWVILRPDTPLVHRFFPDLPPLPDDLL